MDLRATLLLSTALSFVGCVAYGQVTPIISTSNPAGVTSAGTTLNNGTLLGTPTNSGMIGGRVVNPIPLNVGSTSALESGSANYLAVMPGPSSVSVDANPGRSLVLSPGGHGTTLTFGDPHFGIGTIGTMTFLRSGTSTQLNSTLNLLGQQPSGAANGVNALNINYNGGAPTRISSHWVPAINEHANITGTVAGTYALNVVGTISSVNGGFFQNEYAVALDGDTSGSGAVATYEYLTGDGIKNWSGDFGAANFWGFGNSNVGGTTLTGTSAKGAAFAINPQVVLNPGATYWQEMNPQENDVALFATTQAVTIGGTATAGDAITIALQGARLNAGKTVDIVYTVGSAEAMGSVCQAFGALLSTNATLAADGVGSICAANGSTLTINWPFPQDITVRGTVSGARSETLTTDKVRPGASVAKKEGLDIIRLGGDSGAGASGGDVALSLGSQLPSATGGWIAGFMVYSDAIKPTGTIFAATPYTSYGGSGLTGFINPLEAAVGVDLSLVDFAAQSGYSLKMPAMSVSGTGALTLGSVVLTPQTEGLAVSAQGYVGPAVGSTIRPTSGGGGGGGGQRNLNYYVGDVVHDPYGGQYTVTGVNPATGAITTLHEDVQPAVTGSSPGSGPFALSYGSGARATISIAWTQAGTLDFTNVSTVELRNIALQANGSGNPSIIKAVGSDRDVSLRFNVTGTGELQANAHLAIIGGGTPRAAACGGTGSVSGNDTVMTVTAGPTATSTCTITPGTHWPAAPVCLVSPGNPAAARGEPYVSSTAANEVVVSFVSRITRGIIRLACYSTS